MRHCLAKLICLFALGLTAFGQTRAADRSLGKPNIVILLADDLGYGELGCQGNTEIPTPHIDSIAANGVRFTNGYVTAPFCSASREGLITGRYQTRFGYAFNPMAIATNFPASDWRRLRRHWQSGSDRLDMSAA